MKELKKRSNALSALSKADMRMIAANSSIRNSYKAAEILRRGKPQRACELIRCQPNDFGAADSNGRTRLNKCSRGEQR